MSIERIGSERLHLVREIAVETWPVAFGEILSTAQLEYMMEMMYNPEVLKNQLAQGHEFYLYYHEQRAIAFMGVELNYKEQPQLKIHKLYVLPGYQGKGVGEAFIALAEERCRELGYELLTLNVNRFNKAVYFYEKLNFIRAKSEDIAIGQGYLMEDYVMEKKIN